MQGGYQSKFNLRTGLRQLVLQSRSRVPGEDKQMNDMKKNTTASLSTVNVDNLKVHNRVEYLLSKIWRDKVLSFYDRKAAFVYDCPMTGSRKIVHTTFEPCVQGSVLKHEDGVLYFKTDLGVYMVECDSRSDIKEIVKRSRKCMKTGRSKTFMRLLAESFKKHGWLNGHPLPPIVGRIEDQGLNVALS